MEWDQVPPLSGRPEGRSLPSYSMAEVSCALQSGPLRCETSGTEIHEDAGVLGLGQRDALFLV